MSKGITVSLWKFEILNTLYRRSWSSVVLDFPGLICMGWVFALPTAEPSVDD
jgi:hypothetical protein